MADPYATATNNALAATNFGRLESPESIAAKAEAKRRIADQRSALQAELEQLDYQDAQERAAQEQTDKVKERERITSGLIRSEEKAQRDFEKTVRPEAASAERKASSTLASDQTKSQEKQIFGIIPVDPSLPFGSPTKSAEEAAARIPESERAAVEAKNRLQALDSEASSRKQNIEKLREVNSLDRELVDRVQMNRYQQLSKEIGIGDIPGIDPSQSNVASNKSEKWLADQKRMSDEAAAYGLPPVKSDPNESDSRLRIKDAIRRSTAAGYPVRHFMGKPNEPEGDRAPTMDIENLVAALRKQEETLKRTGTPRQVAAVGRERAYWEKNLKEGMSAQQWKQQTGEDDPAYPQDAEALSDSRYDAAGMKIDSHPVSGGTPDSIQRRAAAQAQIDPAQFETKLTPDEESKFQAWKAQYAPNDSGNDYDLRGAFKAGVTPDQATGHWPDTFKKPNEPTFSNQSIYAKARPDLAGSWDANDNFVLPADAPISTTATLPPAGPSSSEMAPIPKSFDQKTWDANDKAAWQALPKQDKAAFTRAMMQSNLQDDIIRQRRAILDKQPPVPSDWKDRTSEQKQRLLADFQARKEAEAQRFDDQQAAMSPERKAIVDALRGGQPMDFWSSLQQELGGRSKTAAAAAGMAYASVGTGILDLATAAQAAFGINPDDTWTRQFADGVRLFYNSAQDPEYRDAVATKLASTLASAHAMMAPGGVLGKVLGGTPRAITAATAITGAVVNGGQAYSEALDMGMTDAQAFERLAAGMALGTTEAVGVGNILAKLNRLSRGNLGKFIRNLASQGLEEGGQEAFQSAGQDLADWLILGKDDKRAKPLEQIKQDAINNGLWGAVSGILFTGLVDGAQRHDLRARSRLAAEELSLSREKAASVNVENVATEIAAKFNDGLQRSGSGNADEEIKASGFDPASGNLPFSASDSVPALEAKLGQIKSVPRQGMSAEQQNELRNAAQNIEQIISGKALTPDQVKIAMSITPSVSGEIDSIESDIAQAEAELALHSSSADVFFNPTDFEKRIEAQSKLAKAYQRKASIAQAIQNGESEISSVLTQAQEISKFKDEPADPNGNGKPNGSSQRQIIQAIARVANGMELSQADLNLLGSNGRPIFQKDKKTGTISLSNPETLAALQQGAPLIYSAWKARERSQMEAAQKIEEPSVGRGAKISPGLLSGKTASQLQEIASQLGVDSSVQPGEMPLTAAEIADLIMAQQSAGQGSQVAGDERFAPPVWSDDQSQGSGSAASVPVMITKRMEADLLARGFSQEAINKMTPTEAWNNLQGTPTAASPEKPNSSTALRDLEWVKKNFAHNGELDANAASDQLAKEATDALAAGGRVIIRRDGREIPISSVRNGQFIDDEGNPWGVAAMLFPRKGTNDGFVISPKSPEEGTARTETNTGSENSNDNLQFEIGQQTGKAILDFGRSIPESDLYKGEEGSDSYSSGDYGRETAPHITLLYGPNTPPEEIQKALNQIGPVSVTLGKVSLFSGEKSPYDVVKIDVHSPELQKLHSDLKSRFGTASEFKDYHPHITIAYVKKGEGKKYSGDTRFEGQQLSLDVLTHSDRDSLKTHLPLSGAQPVKEPAQASTQSPEAVTEPPAQRPRLLIDAIRDKDRVKFHGMSGFLRLDTDGSVVFRKQGTQELYEVSPSVGDRAISDVEGLSLDRVGQRKREKPDGAIRYSVSGRDDAEIAADFDEENPATWELPQSAIDEATRAQDAMEDDSLTPAQRERAHDIFTTLQRRASARADISQTRNAAENPTIDPATMSVRDHRDLSDPAERQSLIDDARSQYQNTREIAANMGRTVSTWDQFIKSGFTPEESAILGEAGSGVINGERIYSRSSDTGSKSRGRPLPRAAITEAKGVASFMRSKIPGLPKVEILTKEQIGSLPDDQASDRIEGFYDPEQPDTVFIVPENIRPRDGEFPARAIMRVILHEAVGHRGIRGVLGPDFSRRIEKLADLVEANAPDFLKKVFAERPDLRPAKADSLEVRKSKRLEAIEEWLAKGAENAHRLDQDERGLLRKVMDWIVDSIDRALGYRLSERDASILLRQAFRYTRDGVGRNNSGSSSAAGTKKVFSGTFAQAADTIAADLRNGSSENDAEMHLVGSLSGEKRPGVISAALGIVKRHIVPFGGVPAEAAALIHEARVSDAYGRKIAADWGNLLDKGVGSTILGFQSPEGGVSVEEREMMFSALNGSLRKGDVLRPELQDIVDRARNVIGRLGERAVQAGLLNPETFDRNRGTYLPRLYAPKELAQRGLFGAGRKFVTMLLDRTGQPRLSDAYAVTKNGRPVSHDEKGNFRFDSEHSRDVFFDQLQRRKVLQWLREQGGVGTITEADIADSSRLAPGIQQRIARLKSRFAETYEKNTPWSDETLDRMGLIRTPGYPVAKAVVQLQHDIALANLFRQISGNEAWTSEEARPGFDPIPDNPRWGKLAGKYVQEDIARELSGLADAPGAAIQLYDGALRLWKYGKTVINPATHGRNVIGNVMFADLAGVDPLNPLNWRHYVEMTKVLRGASSKVSLDELYREGVLGADFTAAELKDILDSSVGEGLQPENMGYKVFNFLTAKAVRKFAEKAYQLEDEMFKVAAYVKARDQGMSASEAAAHVRAWFPYYDQIPRSSTIASAKRVFPFVSFYYEAMRIAANAIAQHPVKFGKWMAMPTLITLYSLSRLGLDDDDKEAILSQMRGKLFGWPVFSALMPFADSQGKPVQWDLTNVIPYSNVLGLRLDRSDADKPLWQDVMTTLLTSNPVGTIGVALATNEDQFYGRELVVPGMNAPEAAGEIARFVGKTVLPPLTPEVGTTWTTLNAPARMKGTLQLRDQGQAALRALAGIDLRSAEPSLFNAIERFQKDNGYSERPERIGETAVSRARGRLYEALINGDQSGIARELAYLEAEGIQLETPKDIQKWLNYRHPITGAGRIKKDDYTAFMDSLAPIERETATRAVDEFERILEDAPAAFDNARSHAR